MISLLPPSYKQERKFGRRNRTMVMYSFLVLLIGVSSVGIMLFNLQISNREVAQLQNEIDDIANASKAFDEEQNRFSVIASNLGTVEKLYDKQITFSTLIPQFAELLPPGTVLNGLTLNEGRENPLNLSIDMERQELAAVFQQNLVNSDLFESADVINIVSKGDISADSTEAYPFSATLTVGFANQKKVSSAPAGETQ